MYIFLLLSMCLFGLPLVGTWLSGEPLLPFLAFPPRTIQVDTGTVSWPLFVLAMLCIVLTLSPFLLRMLTFSQTLRTRKKPNTFPVWGWVALWGLLGFWVLAWSRLTWVGEYQLHTFTPLWLNYIVLVNALTDMRTHRCLLVHQPRIFYSLFPVSAVFWWTFEYLNRFAQNWYYLPNIEVDGLTYFLLGSLSFSTVLPAMYGTYELLLSFPRLNDPFKAWIPLPTQNMNQMGWILCLTACLGLLGIGLWPRITYPLIWLSPLFLLLGFQILQRKSFILESLRQGDWRPVVIPAMAGLMCGFLWELWNSQSFAHWEYAIPHLHAFNVFEMPILGYAGYIPFGIECIVCVQILWPHVYQETSCEKLAITKPKPPQMSWQTPWHHTKNI